MKIAIRASSGKFVSAEQGGGLVYGNILYANQSYPGVAPLYANRAFTLSNPPISSDIGPWETYERINNPDGSFSLKTHAGKFVSAELGGGVGVSTDRAEQGPWESFFEKDGGIQCWDRLHFLTQEEPSDAHINSRGTEVNAWQQFEFISLDSTNQFDPSSITLQTLAAVRGAMWTVRGPWQYGPRPNQSDNITALEYIYSYGDPYNPNNLGGAFNLNDEQRAMITTYKSFDYTHCCFGPITAQSYRGHYPDYSFSDPATFDRWLDWLQMFWDNQIIPICFLHPDGWDLNQTRALYDPLIQNNPRAQRLMRAIVPSGWEPAKYEWSANTWASYMKWGHEILPNALILLHTVPDVDAPGGTDEAGDDNNRGNEKVWADITPHIHGWLHQASSFDNPDAHGDPNHPDNTNYDNWADLFDKSNDKSYWNRFHNGYAGWPTNSLWGYRPIYVYAAEYCSYWNYHDNRPYAEGVGWGDRAVSIGADGYLDSGSVAVPIQE